MISIYFVSYGKDDMKKMHVKHLADYLAHGQHAINVTTVSIVAIVMTPRSRSLWLSVDLQRTTRSGLTVLFHIRQDCCVVQLDLPVDKVSKMR